MISLLPVFLISASASSFSFADWPLPYSVASFMALSSCVRMSAGMPSQNFLFMTTT